MIINKDGRLRSLRTADEIEALLEEDIEGLEPAEREVLDLIMKELRGEIAPPDGKPLIEVISEAEYKRTPVDMRTFVTDPYYLGASCSTLYPKLLEHLIEVFEGEYQEVILGGAIGIGKTFCASIGICRILYEISCLREPQISYGIAPGSTIDIVCVSVKAELARQVAFENIATKVKASPYFQEYFPFEPTKKEILFPSNVRIQPLATTETSALGMNVHTAFIDEADFMPTRRSVSGEQENRSDTIHASIWSRMQSRFGRKGKLPGKLFVASSKTTSEGFTTKRLTDLMHNPKVYAIDYSNWEVKPDAFYKTKRFHVLCGNADIASKILTPEEYEELKGKNPEGTVIIEVPEDYRSVFEQDLEKSIRDQAGIATVSITPYIQRREKIMHAFELGKAQGLQHPFSTEVYDMSKGGTFLWGSMVALRQERAPNRIVETKLRPIINPTATRHIHMDLGLRKDALGFTMAHIGGYKQVVRRTEDGREFFEEAPVYIVDVMLRIIPPMGGEVILAEARHLVYDIIQHGYVITSVSFDSWQSADSIQQLNARGIFSQVVSVDREPHAYDTLKTALYEDRVIMYEYAQVRKELSMLQEDYSRGQRKIDHPPKGCFVGSTRVLLQDGSQPQIQDLDGVETWVYSATTEGYLMPGKARGRKTKSTTDLVDVVLDYGAIERCTPEHPWMLRDGSYVEAQKLLPGMKLMPVHQVQAVCRVKLDKPVDVFDLEVDQWSNFQLASGVVVHNSKDVSDALAGTIFTLSTQRIQQPLPIMKGSAYSAPTAWMDEQRQFVGVGNQNPSSNQPLPFLVGTQGIDTGGGWNSGGGGDDGGGWGPLGF